MEDRVRSDIREYIASTWLSGDSRGFDDETDLQANGILDSFATLALIAFLDDTFKTQLDPSDVSSESFRTVHSVAELVISRIPT